MHALTAFSLPVFRVPGFDLLERTEFFAWLIQIGRRLAVLRGNRPALTYRRYWDLAVSWGVCHLIDLQSIFQYRQTKDTPPTGARDWKSRIPADGPRGKRLVAATGATVSAATSKQASAPTWMRGPVLLHREIHFECSPFTGGTTRVRLRGRDAAMSRGAAETVPPAPKDREYSAGSRLFPFLVQTISCLFIMFQRVDRTPDLSKDTVGNLAVSKCSRSGAVKRSSSIPEIAALIVCESLENPVDCAVSKPRDLFTACKSSRFFWTRFLADSASPSSFSICLTRSLWMPLSFICKPTSFTLPGLIRI